MFETVVSTGIWQSVLMAEEDSDWGAPMTVYTGDYEPDTDQALTVVEMAQGLVRLGRPVQKDESLGIDLDDYPLY